MITHDYSITIARPVTQVFGFLSDFPAVLDWQDEFTEMTPISAGPLRSGYRYRYARKLPIGTQRGTMEITEYEPDAQLGWRAWPGPVLPSGTWTFTPLDDGGTRVDEHFTAEIRGPLRLLTPLLRRQFGRDVGKDLHTAKTILETTRPAAPSAPDIQRGHPRGAGGDPLHPTQSGRLTVRAGAPTIAGSRDRPREGNPIELSCALTLHRPPAQVFAILTDLERYLPQWAAGPVRVDKATPGPTTTGTRFTVTAKIAGLRVRSPYKVTCWEPDKRFGGQGIAGPVRFNEHYQLDPTEAANTTLRYTIQAHPRGLFRLLRTPLSHQLHQLIDNDLGRFTALVEHAQPAPADPPA